MYPEDTARLQFFSNCRLDLETLCPYVLREPLAPMVAARRSGRTIDLDRILQRHTEIAAMHDVTIVEGAGGLLVPLTPTQTFATLAAELRIPVLVVVGSRLGAINHALLTLHYARCAGLEVLGYVVNRFLAGEDLATQTNDAVFTDWMGPALGVVPHFGDIALTEASRQQLADLFRAALRIDDLLVPD